MTTALYVLADEYQAAARKLADLDLDEQTIADTLEGLAGELEVKATNVAMFVRNLEASAAAIKDAEAQMAKRRKSFETRAANVRAYLLSNMEFAQISKIECPFFKLAVRDNPPAVVIDNQDALPIEYMRWPDPPPPPMPEPDKKAIAAAIKEGKTVDGAHMERTKRLEIK